MPRSQSMREALLQSLTSCSFIALQSFVPLLFPVPCRGCKHSPSSDNAGLTECDGYVAQYERCQTLRPISFGPERAKSMRESDVHLASTADAAAIEHMRQTCTAGCDRLARDVSIGEPGPFRSTECACPSTLGAVRSAWLRAG